MLEIICPSGLRGTLRGMKVKDEELFTDRKLGRSGKVISRLLSACWTSTIDPGPYTFPTGTVDFDEVLAADRTYALVQLRIASYGKDYEFRVTCSTCKTTFGWGVDLSKLDVKPVSETGRLHVKTKQPLVVDLADGRKALCRLITGADDEFFSGIDVKDEARTLTYHLARRIVELDGKRHWADVLALVEDMEAGVADRLWDVTDELEGGVETSFDVECRKCSTVQQVLLPFEAGFFSSRKRFARSRTNENGSS